MPELTRNVSHRLGREMQFQQEQYEEYVRMTQVHPTRAIRNEHLFRPGSRWGVGERGEWTDGPRLARAVADYVPHRLKAEFIRYSLEHPEREWLGPRGAHRPDGSPAHPIPGTREQLVVRGIGRPAHHARPSQPIARAQAELVRNLDQRTNPEALAAVLANVGEDERDTYRCNSLVYPDNHMTSRNWWRAQIERCYPYRVPTPKGDIVLYTRPPAYVGQGKTYQDIVNTAFSQLALMQLAELDRPGSTDQPEVRDAIRQRAYTQGRILTTEDNGGIINLGYTPRTGPFGQVEGVLTDSGTRGHVFIIGGTGSGKTEAALSMLASMDAPAAMVVEPKAEDTVKIANNLQQAGHKVCVVDLRPNAPETHELHPLTQVDSIHDYLDTGPPRYAGFDPVEDAHRLVGPGGYEAARGLAYEIFDSLERTIESGSTEGKTNAGVFRVDAVQGIAACLSAAAIDHLTQPAGGGSPPPFWDAFDNYLSTLTGETPNPDIHARIESLQQPRDGNPPLIPQTPKGGYMNGVFRGQVLAGLMRDLDRRHNEHPSDGVSPETTAKLVREADSHGGAIEKMETTRGRDVLTWLYKTGHDLLRETYPSLADPGAGVTVAQLHDTQTIACVAVGGEDTGKVGLAEQWFSRMVTRQTTVLKDQEVACEQRVAAPTAAAILDAYAPLGGIPSEASEKRLPPQEREAARSAGFPAYPRPLIAKSLNDLGALRQSVTSLDGLRAELSIGGKASTIIASLQSSEDLVALGVGPGYANAHIIVGVGPVHMDPGLVRQFKDASNVTLPRVPMGKHGEAGRPAIKPPSEAEIRGRYLPGTTVGDNGDVRWWGGGKEGADPVPEAAYGLVQVPSKLSGREDPNRVERYPASHGNLFVTRLSAPPATRSDATLKVPHTADGVLAQTTVRADGALLFPTPSRDGLGDVVKHALSDRAIRSSQDKAAGPMRDFVQATADFTRAKVALERLDVSSIGDRLSTVRADHEGDGRADRASAVNARQAETPDRPQDVARGEWETPVRHGDDPARRAHGQAEGPAAREPERPATREPERPAAREPERPATREPERPATREPERPAAREPERPAAREPERPAAREPERPAAREPEGPAAREPEEPAHEAHGQVEDTTAQASPQPEGPERQEVERPEQGRGIGD